MVRKLFLTPPDTPSEIQCRSIEIPGSKEWLGIFNNAILQLANPFNYEQVNDTDLTPEEVAAACYEIYVAYQQSVCGGAPAEIETPFWDDAEGDDADDEEAPVDQTWYGIWDGETFLETISYVFLTAFISTLVGTGAAVKFLSVPRTFRLLVRKNPHGAKLLVFLDSGLFGLINTYAASNEVETVTLVSPGTTLMLVVSDEHDASATPNADGDYVVDVIRSRLTADDVLPPTIRYDGDPPVFQTTTDDGATWVDTPDADPRYNPAGLLPPLTPYGGIECDVAARMTAQLKDTLDMFIESINAAQFASEVLAIIGIPLGLVGWLIDVVLFVANALIDIGQANIETAFTEAIYDDIQCIFSCYIEADGSITQHNLDQAYNDIQTAHTGTVAGVIGTLRQLYGDVAMSNAGVSRDDTGDCSGCDPCDWFVEFDFREGQSHGWRVFTDSSYAYGAFIGTAFRGARTGGILELVVYMQQAGIEITGASYHGTTFHGTGGGNAIYIQDVTSTADPPSRSTIASSGLPTVTDGWVTFSPAFTTTYGFLFYLICDSNGTGELQIDRIRLGGTGTPPINGLRVSGLS